MYYKYGDSLFEHQDPLFTDICSKTHIYLICVFLNRETSVLRVFYVYFVGGEKFKSIFRASPAGSGRLDILTLSWATTKINLCCMELHRKKPT